MKTEFYSGCYVCSDYVLCYGWGMARNSRLSGFMHTKCKVIFIIIESPWPARSPDLTPCDYFLWGYVKDKMFVPPQPVSIPDLKNRITAAVETITLDLLSRVWQELDYRLDVCRVTKGAYIEHL